jgi:chromosome segregation ATPase
MVTEVHMKEWKKQLTVLQNNVNELNMEVEDKNKSIAHLTTQKQQLQTEITLLNSTLEQKEQDMKKLKEISDSKWKEWLSSADSYKLTKESTDTSNDDKLEVVRLSKQLKLKEQENTGRCNHLLLICEYLIHYIRASRTN